MDHPEGARETCDVRVGFDRRVRLEFHGSKISSDGGLLLFRELDEVLGLHDIAGGLLRDTRTGHNRLHTLVGLLRQSVLRSDFDGATLRRLARTTTNANQGQRLLALAEIYDGRSRSDAARIGGVGLQIVRDWVVRFNTRGPDGLINGECPRLCV